MFKIDKNIPPPHRLSKAQKFREFFATLEVGDSFEFTNNGEHGALSGFYAAGTRMGLILKVKRIDGQLFRVWMVGRRQQTGGQSDAPSPLN